MSGYLHLHNFGGHNALLEASYAPWARNGLLSPLLTLCRHKVTHIEWAGNQPLVLKFVFKPKGSLCEFIHSFFTLERGD